MSNSINPKPFVSIILPVYNEEKYLSRCLETLREIDYPKDKYEIITVDNGSSDNSFSIAKQYANQSLHLPDVNVGAVRNYGVKHAKGEILVFLDSDCLVKENWLSYGVNQLDKHPKTAFGGNLYLRDNPTWIEKYWLLFNPNKPITQTALLGSCTFVKKSDFIKAGGFNEDITSGEDTELSKKLSEHHCDIAIEPLLGVVHLGNPQTITEFLKRQMWHSENYLHSLPTSVRDITFWLVLIFLFGVAGLIGVLLGAPLPLAMVTTFVLTPPLLLSTKRIFRSGFKPNSGLDILCIFTIDVLYLCGRCAGIIKSVIR